MFGGFKHLPTQTLTHHVFGCLRLKNTKNTTQKLTCLLKKGAISEGKTGLSSHYFFRGHVSFGGSTLKKGMLDQKHLD